LGAALKKPIKNAMGMGNGTWMGIVIVMRGNVYLLLSPEFKFTVLLQI
jgi:hypothetical protein